MTGPLVADSLARGVWENLMDPWVIVGYLGQAVFGARFVLQWLASERAGKVVIPTVFWWLSIAGSAITLVYAAYRRDPVFILANLLNFGIYARNLALLRRGAPPAPGAAA